MRILAIGCMHGKWVNGFRKYIKRNKIDAIFAMGDFYGESIRPVFRKYMAQLPHDKYGVVSSTSLMKVIGKRRYFNLENTDIKSGVKIFRKLDSMGIPVYMIHGNGDGSSKILGGKPEYGSNGSIENIIRKSKYRNIRLLDYKTETISGHELLFFGIRLFNPYRGQHPATRRKILRNMKLHEKSIRKILKDPGRTIVITHSPPFKTTLDRVNDKRNPGYGQHFGDIVLRKIIEKKKPLMTIGAHFHENQGFDRIGKTKLVCTGYGRAGQAAILELKEGKEPKVKLVKIR